MLTSKRLILRLFKESDLDDFLEKSQNVKNRGDVYPLIFKSHAKFKKQYAETGFWEEESGKMLITTKDGRPIGYIVYWRPVRYFHGYEIGYVLFDPQDWGKGYISEAVPLFVAYLFSIKPVDRLQAATDEENIGSQKVLEKSGFTYEGTLRKAVFGQGKITDLKMYSILREESAPLSAYLV